MSCGTPDLSSVRFPSYTGLSPSSAAAFNPLFSSVSSLFCWSLPPSPFLQIGLGSSAFARHYLRNHFCFLFLRVLRCFSSPRLPPLSYLFHLTVTALSWLPGSPIRTSAYIRLFAPTRGFSQLVTSFFVSQCQGIPPALLVA